MTVTDDTLLESVDLVLDLIERLAASPRPLGVTEIARELGISKARAHRHLRALVRRGYARQDPATERYEIGARLLPLGEMARERFGVLDAMRPEMTRLREATGQAVTASVLVDGAVTVLEMLPGRMLIEFGVRPGARLELGSSAQGIVALAFGPAALLEGVLAGTLDRSALAADVAAVRRQGWATAADRVLAGVNALAAPVLDHGGQMRAALAIVGSTQLIAAQPSAEQIAEVTAAARRASLQLGWRAQRHELLPMSHSLAVDIGGTFVDVVLRAPDGTLTVDKTLTTHHDLLEGFFRAVDLALDKARIEPSALTGVVVHATTVVTNALIERRGQATALITTKGFADVLAIRNEHRYEMYDPQIEFAPPLIPRDLTFELDERVLADGTVLKGVDPAEAAALAATLKARGVVSVAVCLLNGFRNPANEQAVGEALRAALPGLHLSLSSSVAPQIREYPRASTTAINAYAAPIAQPYLHGMARRLAEIGAPNRPLIMLSSGGVIGAETASRNPVRMIESGPAAGALAAAHYARRLGLARMMSFDMGGTTAKACLIEDGQPMVTGAFEVDRKYRFCEGSGMPVTVPSIDMIEIGAGGGSIAHVDDLGLLKVGPRSAGSEPGPACYGRGGTEPTVTDADLVLGLLDGDNFLGGDMALDRPAAERAIAGLADALDCSVAEAAGGVYRIVAEAMAGAARAHATDRGVDHRGLALLAFGGAGPVHACAVGELLQSSAVIFPPQASVLSAVGTLVTPVRLDLVRSALGRLDGLDWAEVDRLLDEMTTEGLASLAEAGCAADTVRIGVGADLRYHGQQNEVTVSFDHDPRQRRDPDAIRAAFEAAYVALYGVTPSHVPIEIVSWRMTVQGPEIAFAPTPNLNRAPGLPKGERRVALWAAAGPAQVYDRASLGAGQRIAGPAIIEERETTLVIPPTWSAVVDDLGCVVARQEA